MLDLLETLLVRYGIQNLRYDGKMRSESREAALVVFRKAGGPRVILISTKCGGVGLNLTSANRVIKCVRLLFFFLPFPLCTARFRMC
jgi:SNF2 family DNA or RNA helicase